MIAPCCTNLGSDIDPESLNANIMNTSKEQKSVSKNKKISCGLSYRPHILYNFIQFGSHASRPFFFIAAIIFSQFIRILLDFNCTKISGLVPN